jgi:hypothetical protein
VTASPAERYLRLGLRVGRHVDGIVDAYFGPPELAAEVAAEPLVEPRALTAEADALLDDLEDGWLRDQVAGVRTYAGVLAGEKRSYADEVEGCYGVRPTWTDEGVFAAAHERLAALLPGEEPLADRHERWKAATRIPAERIEETLAATIEEARVQARVLVELPSGEGVDLEIVHDRSWWAFCGYHGDFRSRIDVNVDLPMSAVDLLVLSIHETYPGHHVERAAKEQLLVRGRGMLEETLALVPTPQSVVSEGIASVAPFLLLEGGGGAALAAIVRRAGVDFDLAEALAVQRALDPCRWAEVNAALMLHEHGADEADVCAYLGRWALASPEIAAHIVRFLQAPTSRTYITTYPAGRDLCEASVGGTAERFRRLLTEQVRVRELAAEAERTYVR